MLSTVPVAQPVIPIQVQPPPPPPSIVPKQPSLWRTKFPAIASGILSFLQYGITFIIIGCEVGSILIDMVTATIYVGFWASLFFMSAWISQSASSCCCRNRPCATYTLINQCIALAFATCVIGFDAYFIDHPTTCFFPSSVCSGSGYSRGVFFSSTNFYNVKIPLIIGQLVAGVVMFVLCLISIALYVITALRVQRATQPSLLYSPIQYMPTAQYASPTLPVGSDGMMVAPPPMNVRQPRPGSPLYHRPMIVTDNGDGRTNDLLCPTCSTMMAVTIRKKPPQ